MPKTITTKNKIQPIIKKVYKNLGVSTLDNAPKPKPDGSILDYLKAEFFNKNPNANNSTGAGFFRPDIVDISIEDQNIYFNLMKNMFTDLNVNKPKMSIEEYSRSYYDLLESVTEMAVCGCVPAMDYLCFIYKKGVDDVMSINLTRAHEWGMLAIAGGSKLSVDRLRMFLDPVYKYITQNGLVKNIIKNHSLENEDDLINFVAYSFANIFNEKRGLTLGYMSKKNIISSESFQMFLKETATTRDECLPLLKKYIA